ncbi:TRAP transporter small permease subunit [Pseudahrensia aquimaris]|uniref:TRAP transporter small permease protein n=1 Tax=Pseudahrensia aquimaris TaxID=744461 RepID=A0ABW3FD03_9HYPH
MPGNEIKTVEDVIAITDPGEVNRDEHLWGDRLMVNLANVGAWIFPLLIVAIVTQVVIRKMGNNQAWLDDAQWWMYGVAMLIGFGYAITTNSHVRVDIFHQNYSEERKSKIEVFALGWLLLPFLILMTDILIHYAGASITAREGSDSANGLHMLYLLKASLPILFTCAIIASIAAMLRFLARIGKLSLFSVVLGSLPALSFGLERVVYYFLWWVVRLTNPDIADRRISREPLLAHTTEIAFGLTLLLLAIGYFRLRSASSETA